MNINGKVWDMKTVIVAFVATVVLVSGISLAWAGGDQVHGEKGQGSTVRTSNPWV